LDKVGPDDSEDKSPTAADLCSEEKEARLVVPTALAGAALSALLSCGVDGVPKVSALLVDRAAFDCCGRGIEADEESGVRVGEGVESGTAGWSSRPMTLPPKSPLTVMAGEMSEAGCFGSDGIGTGVTAGCAAAKVAGDCASAATTLPAGPAAACGAGDAVD